MTIGLPSAISDLLVASRPTFSLLDAPGVLWTPGNERWLAGVATVPDQCSVPLDIDDADDGDFPYWWECAAGTSAVSLLTGRGIGDGRPAVEASTFEVWVGTRCTAGSESGEERERLERRLRRKLDAVTRVALEREFWTGQIASRAGFPNRWLAELADTTVVNGGGRTGFVTALAELEQELADHGNVIGRTYVHAQPRVVTAWVSAGLVDVAPDGTFLRTKLGTVVVPGVGYTGGAPGDEASTGSMAGSWAYATGPVRVAVSQPSDVQWGAATLIRDTNERQARMSRDVIVVWDPCVKVAVHVNPCDEYCGTGS